MFLNIWHSARILKLHMAYVNSSARLRSDKTFQQIKTIFSLFQMVQANLQGGWTDTKNMHGKSGNKSILCGPATYYSGRSHGTCLSSATWLSYSYLSLLWFGYNSGLCGGTRKCHMLSDIGTLKAWDSKGLCPVLSFHHTTDRNNTSIPMAAAF